jgi:hypothetical protein
MEKLDAERMDRVGLTRVEIDGEYKYLYKQCTCGNEFRTAIPRKFFKNSDDESLELAVTATGGIKDYPDIKATDVKTRIEQENCGDKEQHPEEQV